MPRPEKTPSPKEPANPDLFFEKELAGESALTRSTAERLYHAAMDFDARSPWEVLEDQDLILLPAPDSREMCYCSVMGAIGQVFSMHAYLGQDAFGLFKKIASGQPLTVGEFFAAERSVSVELVPRGELTPPDRGLLSELGHVFKRGALCPVFRAGRPGYHPWYITEGEGQLLAFCLEAVNAFYDHLESHPDTDYWDEEDTYPLVTIISGNGPQSGCRVDMAKTLSPLISMMGPSAFDESRAARILRAGLPVGGVLELDHFYGGTTFGRKHERKACMRVAIAVEAKSGYAYPPALGTPLDTTSDLLANALFEAIESARFLPNEVRVRDAGFAISLGPLVKALGIGLQIVPSLPALDFFKQHVLQAMGDPGTILNQDPDS